MQPADLITETEGALKKPLDPEKIRKRQGPGGKRLEYLSGADVAQGLNEVFGPLGWSTTVDRLETEAYTEERVDKRTGEAKTVWCAVSTALVSLRLHPRMCALAQRQDVGHGLSDGQPTKGGAIELAEKSATTDALKRAAHFLGPRLGLALYVPKSEREDAGLVGDDEPPPPAEKRPDPKPERKPPGGVFTEDEIPMDVDEEPMAQLARWMLEGTLEGVVQEALRAGDHPGRTSELLEGRLPEDPTREALAGFGVDEQVLEDLVRWPAGDPLTREVLNEIHTAAEVAVGAKETKRLWRELGVELKRGAQVTGYQARLLAAAAAGK